MRAAVYCIPMFIRCFKWQWGCTQIISSCPFPMFSHKWWCHWEKPLIRNLIQELMAPIYIEDMPPTEMSMQWGYFPYTIKCQSTNILATTWHIITKPIKTGDDPQNQLYGRKTQNIECNMSYHQQNWDSPWIVNWSLLIGCAKVENIYYISLKSSNK